MKMGFRVFVGFVHENENENENGFFFLGSLFVHEMLLFLRQNLIENENDFFFGSLLYTACVLGQCFFLFDF